MIENGRLYRFESNAWQDLGASSVSSTASKTAVDIAVAKSALVGLAPFFEVGFKDIDTTWNLRSALPASGTLAPYPGQWRRSPRYPRSRKRDGSTAMKKGAGRAK